jgi:hypothetical protein
LKASFGTVNIVASTFTSLFADTTILVALPSELDGVRKEVRLGGKVSSLPGAVFSSPIERGKRFTSFAQARES